MDILKKPEKCCDRVKWQEKEEVVHGEITNIFETLAIGFGEKSGDEMAKKICLEITKVNTFTEFLS